jgi:hypothetical protein
VKARSVLLTMSSTKAVPIVDPEAVDYNRRIVLAATITVLVLSNTSYILRLVARRMQHQRLQADDYFMGLALPFSKSALALLPFYSHDSLEDNVAYPQITIQTDKKFG